MSIFHFARRDGARQGRVASQAHPLLRAALLAALAAPALLGARGCEGEGDPEGCFCTEEYAPVCGVDGVTYGNACHAACDDVAVAHVGECSVACPDIYAPVCGTDGVTYSSGCVAHAAGVMVLHTGACECAPVLCDIYCEFGHVADEHGCPTCACEPPPACLPVACDLACEYGHAVDEYGCETCACLPPPMCEPVTCRLACEHGFATDDRGCEICECAPGPELCLDDAECGPGAYCDHSECLSSCDPSDPEIACPAVCYGACRYDMPPPPPPPDRCGGFTGAPCANPSDVCIDDPTDECDPHRGGADCPGICVPEEPPPPEVCYSDRECADGYRCDTSECHSPCMDGDDTCIAVCVGICTPTRWCGTDPPAAD